MAKLPEFFILLSKRLQNLESYSFFIELFPKHSELKKSFDSRG